VYFLAVLPLASRHPPAASRQADVLRQTALTKTATLR
jgi:hypothetical protein